MLEGVAISELEASRVLSGSQLGMKEHENDQHSLEHELRTADVASVDQVYKSIHAIVLGFINTTVTTGSWTSASSQVLLPTLRMHCVDAHTLHRFLGPIGLWAS